MKFWVNMNLPRALCSVIQHWGYPCRHVADVGLANASDERIVQEARLTDEIILTHDLNYSRILAFSGESRPSVIIFRVSNPSLPILIQRLQATLQLASPDLKQGAIISVEDEVVRIRRLPMRT